MLIQLKYAIVAIILVSVVIGGISLTKYNALFQRYQATQSANAQLQREVEDLKYGADRLLAQARSNMEKKDYTQVIATADQLLQRHPESPEATTAKNLKGQANEFLNQQRIAKERAERAERERVAREERARVAAEKARVAQALSNMRTKYDDMRAITWYYAKSTPKYDNTNNIHLYFGKEKDGSLNLRLRIRYAADDWLFVNNYRLKIDGADYDFTPLRDVERDNSYGGIWEWSDDPVVGDTKTLVRALANAQSVKMRYNGDQYYKDRTVSSTEIRAIRDVLTAYKAMGGSF